MSELGKRLRQWLWRHGAGQGLSNSDLGSLRGEEAREQAARQQ